jgi:hypothetical protein
MLILLPVEPTRYVAMVRRTPWHDAALDAADVAAAERYARHARTGADVVRPTGYFVVPAPGFYGDRTRVPRPTAPWPPPAAPPAAPGRCATLSALGPLRRGDEWLRVWEIEGLYPVAWRS